MRHHAPLAASLAASAVWAATIATAGNPGLSGSVVPVVLVGLAVLGFWLALREPLVLSVTGLVTLSLCFTLPDQNPLPVMIAAGGWAVGRSVRSHWHLTAELRLRTAQLDAERAQYTNELIHLERTRLSRELHDVIAHTLSAVVIQAAAAQRLADPAAVDAAVDTIEAVVRQARLDIDAFADPDAAAPSEPPAPRTVIDAVLAPLRSSWTSVEVETVDDWSPAQPTAAELACRIVEEALTNAARHAPGTAVQLRLTIDPGTGTVDIDICNGTAPATPKSLDPLGAGLGLRGLTERVQIRHGFLHSGPEPGGGWRLRARFT